MTISLTNKNKKLITLTVLAFAVILIISTLNTNWLSTVSYTTAYQGAQSSFVGVSWAGHNFISGDSVSGANIKGTGAISLTGTTMSFYGGYDPATGKKYPKITGEMTSVFIPTSESLSNVPTWAQGIATWMMSWMNAESNNANPSNTYNWTINNNNYVMQAYQTKWYITLSSDNTGEIRYGDNTFGPTYSGPLQIWMKLQTNENGWYFSGAPVDTYFAIAKILVVGVDVKAHDPASVQTSPQVAGTTMTCFLSNFGSNTAPSDTQVLSYKGQTLNPTYFNGGIYCVLNLDNFGTQLYGTGFLNSEMHWQGDVIALDLTVYQFVVGEWKVQDIQNPPTNYIKPSPHVGGFDWGGLSEWLGSPAGQMYLAFILIVIVIILIAWRAPWVFDKLRGKKKNE